MHELAQLLVLPPRRATPDRKDTLHVRIEQAFAENALPDHACRTEEKSVHCWR